MIDLSFVFERVLWVMAERPRWVGNGLTAVGRLTEESGLQRMRLS
jgi:hypothetical protein